MGRFPKIAVLLLVGGLLGYVSVSRAIEARGSAVAGTTWQTWQGEDTTPYSIAHYLGEGVLPPDAPQWRLYEARLDNQGSTLDGRCVYTLKGKMPEARWWRISAEGSGAAAEAAHNAWLQSDSAILEHDGTIRIAVSPSPRPGNWIMPQPSKIRLLLFVLEERRNNKELPPVIERISCP
jgi:hypothetical protein